MSAALDILKRVRAAGITLVPDGDLLRVKSAKEPPAELIEELRAHKAELLALLSSAEQPCEPARVEYPLNRTRKQKAASEKKRFVLSPEEHRCIRAMLDKPPEERGVWVQVLRGRWCHYVEQPTEAQLEEEREWQRKFIEDQAKDRRH